MASGNTAYAESRATPRDEVHYRARGFGPDARALSLLIVNISAQGLMARYDNDLPVGARLRVTLPIVGVVAAQVRWSLGGRIGCELDHPIGQADYFDLLAVLIKAK
ncbi:PilZ domain-containing protein [Sphingomonas aliaeris]|uniref:PilZ domain-containing protein n=1 Tax=Sphingomonas aliaeris TaxID=2759526 RepID=A0A974NSN2_9SPHN|nr:PilZ domain-containing protein [Sphingomonas aliaeris]QQV76233.1 PilZ domain-containing protein [Sphingomonas aliaeris]